jgi:hypothetical protein
MHENLSYNPDSFVPDGLEVCEEPIWLEVIGRYSVTGWKDYWGEYDEDFEFEILSWSAGVEDADDED